MDCLKDLIDRYLQPIKNQDFQTKRLSFLTSYYRSLIQDAVDTETDYVCDLKDLIDNYLRPIKTEDFPDSLQAGEKEVFANLMELYKFHHKYDDILAIAPIVTHNFVL